MDNPNVTMEEYIRFEEEKAQRQGRTFNWQTARYGKMEYYEIEDSFTDLETEYPAIVLDDISDAAFSHKPTDTGTRDNGLLKAWGQMDIATLPHRDLRHPWLRYQVDGYDEGIVHNSGDRLSMVYARDDGQAEFTSHAWRRLFELGGARLSGGHFIRRLAAHFGLVGDQGLRGLLVVVIELLVIDLHELAVVAGAPGATAGAPAADKGAQAVPVPVQAPQPSPPALQPQTMSQRIDRLEEEVRDLRQSIVGLRGVFKSSITKQTRVSTWMITCMTQLVDASGRTYQAFDSTLVNSSQIPYQRHVRPKTGDASTSAAPQTDDQPDT
ncbi:hypothetical protein Tco_1541536 [Tanacetum coccineum]